jgi:hypothetical protein
MSEPWEYEIAFYIDILGMSPLDASTFTICRWMWLGDLRPLAEAIDAGPLDAPIEAMLVRLIREDRLRVVPLRAGRPKSPSVTGRDISAALAYEAHPGKSDEAFRAVAEAMNTSEQTVRDAWTRWNARASK